MDPAADTITSAQASQERLFRIDRIPGLADVWERTQGDPDVCIALLDGTVDLSHPALQGAQLTQHDALGRAGGIGAQGREHGTHVASLIFGRPQGPVRGIAPNCRGIAIPIYQDDGRQVACSQKDLAKAINEAVRLGAHVINISGGELSRDGGASDDLRLAIRNCVDQDRVIVAAAGNDGCQECLHVPGAVPSVLAVGAMDEAGEPLPHSNWGEIYRLQGILAPGQHIPGAIPAGGVAPRSGTSFAAAIVSGIAGLLLSLQKQRGEAPKPFLVREALVRTAQGCEGQVSAACDRLLAGRLNVRGAIQFLTHGVSAMTPQITAQSCLQVREEPEPERGGTVAGTEARLQPAADQATSPGGASGGPFGVEAQSARADFGAVQKVSPSCGCGCKSGTGQKVYVVGELDVDFFSPARRDSIQANAPGLPPGLGFENAIENRSAFLRYLLGIDFNQEAENVRGEVREAVEQARRGAVVNGNFYDAESVTWVLKQGECPLYAIKPMGAFAGAAYHQLVIFLIEQTFGDYAEFTNAAIGEHCLEEFYACHGGTQEPFRESLSRPEAVSIVEGGESPEETQPASRRRRRGGKEEEEEPSEEQGSSREPGVWSPSDVINRAFALFNEPTVSAAHVAIAGEITGRARLFTGEEVEVIAPAMRGMQNWNTRRLVEAVLRNPSLNIAGYEAQVTIQALKIVSRLYDLVRNPGKDPCDRARNYLGTKELFNLALTMSNPVFLSMLGATRSTEQRQMAINEAAFLNIALDDLECKPARCVRYGSEPYEVEMSFYNFANRDMGSVVVSQTIDVGDVVPVPIERPRVFPRRS